MSEKKDGDAKATTLHPAYSVTNIQTKIRTLDGTKVTYSSWTKLFCLHAKAYKVSDHINGTPPPIETDPGYVQWAEIDALVLQWIYSTLSDELMARILENDTTAQAAWNKLKSTFLSNKGSHAAALKQEFSNLTLGACSSMETYCQKLKDLADQLGDVDNPVTESRLVLQLVCGLRPEFDVVGAFINQSSPSWDTARSMLHLEQHRKSARQNQTPIVLAAPTSNRSQNPGNQTQGNRDHGNNNFNHQSWNSNSNSRGRGRGSNSRGRGRSNRGRGRGQQQNFWNQQPWNNNSWPKNNNNWTPPPSPYPSAQTTQVQHWANTAFCPNPPPLYGPSHHPLSTPPTPGPAPQFAGYSDYNPSDLAQTMQQVNLNTTDQSWYMDLGASTHLTADPGKISSPLVSSPINTVFVGNGSSLPVHGSGHATHTTHNISYSLKNILFTPSIIKNLLSVRKFTIDNQTSVEFDPYGFTVKDFKTGDPLSRHNSTSDLYPFTSPALSSALLDSTKDSWHARLGHPGTQVLDLLSSRFSISCNKQSMSSLCNSCELSKHTRLPFNDSNSSTFAPFDIIHCDLWTSPVISKSGYKYYMVLIDNFTHYVWIYPLKYKSETFTNFQKFHKFIHTQFNRKIKSFQCDLSGEFDNNDFKTFAHTHGLVFRFSCPQTSQQNGRAERMIRRLNDIIRTLLIHAHLPKSFWVEALHSATYLHNILPTKRLNFSTPAFALYGRHPTYDHLRVFGCTCYPNTSATQTNKLHTRSVKCVFLGYPENFRGYRCYDPSTGKVHLSRHVTFDENSFPFSNSTPPPSSYDFLDDPPFTPFTYTTRPTPPSEDPLIPSPPPSKGPTVQNSPLHTYSRRSKHNATTSIPLENSPLPPESNIPSDSGLPASPLHTSHSTPPVTPAIHPMTTRSRAGITKPVTRLNLHTTTLPTISPLPTSHTQARTDPNWKLAMEDEFTALKANDTWELVPRPMDSPVIRCMWLFRHKFKSDGTLDRYKARLVVNGKSQTVGVDCHETFSPVVKPATIRAVLSLAVSKSWPIHQLDVKNAFLHGDLQETVYMHKPPGFVDPRAPTHVCRLRKSLYGLKQAPRAWYTRFATYIISHGFHSSASDSSLFIYHHGQHMAYLLLYVDDIILTASDNEFLRRIITTLSSEFAMTDLGNLHHFLGITVTRDQHGLFLSQANYARDILQRASMASCKPCTTPVDTSAKLSATAGDPLPDGTLYRTLAGALQYLTFTCPDITYAVQQVCLFMHAPREPHFQFMKRILRYQQGTIDYGLQIVASPAHTLTAYSDADWGGCPDSRRSTSGYCVFLGDNLVSWSSKRQPTISRSSAEAKYRGVANAVAEATWLRNLLVELHVPLRKATVVYCDNISAVYLLQNPVQHQHTKHVEIDIHFVREKVRIGQVRVLHIPSSLQYVDIFTKGLPRHLYQQFRTSLSVSPTTAQTAGEY
ncbi:hypothetical protein L2E82_48745 [Cichorium intybus]|uniref:Uncharacterized protein n=1 Tax=Cichorium intybus TaxID=13427 RepID=A0ACB8YZ19_CICIN|nr:hypothetical protein L2E82_48745 [Cichorium intybus]